jgi:glycosyltransferase involved in cell wall biosynthesis
MRPALLSANPAQANPYIALLHSGLKDAGIDAEIVVDPGPDGLPDAVRAADLVHLHWLELWGRPAYVSLAEWTRLGLAGRGLRRWLEPAANSAWVFERRRQRFLDRFLASLADYKAGGGRLVYTVHNLGQHEGEASRAEEAGLQRLLGLADAIHLHAEYLVPEVQARLGKAARAQVVIIPHGNYVPWYPNQVDRKEARERLDVPATSCLLLFFGMIRPFKGLEELIPAFRAMSDPQALLSVAGQSRPPDYQQRLAQLAAADKRIRWHPQFVPDDEVQWWMNAADVVVLPYRRTTTSGAAMLAFSFGKPILAPDLPAFRELMAGAPFLGELYDPSAPDGLRIALDRACDVNWLSRRALILDWVRQFDWQTIGRRFAELYARVCSGGG